MLGAMSGGPELYRISSTKPPGLFKFFTFLGGAFFRGGGGGLSRGGGGGGGMFKILKILFN